MRHTLDDEQLYRMVEQSLIPSPNVAELDPDVIHTAVSRLGDLIGSVSERYHLDSMLTDAELRRLPSTRETTTLRQYYFTTATEGLQRLRRQSSRWATTHRGDLFGTVLAPCWTDPVAVGALFAVDVLFVRDGSLWRQVPGSDGAIFEGVLTDADRDQIRGSVAPEEAVELDRVVFVVGAFARTSFLYGKRSSRAVSTSAGMLAGALASAAVRSGIRPKIIDQFVDSRIDRALANDGVDRGVVALVTFAEPAARAQESAE